MMNPLTLLRRPEFFFRPTQALRRVWRAVGGTPPVQAAVRLPWGETIQVQTGETIGGAIWHYGIFDLVVTESIWRLLDPGETALDIGANIGQMTSLMRLRAGPNGKVHAFEPHPQLFEELDAFMKSSTRQALAPVELHRLALSNRAGDAAFETGESWSQNRGMGHIADNNSSGSPSNTIAVELARLDDLLPTAVHIGVCKIDVEGHELKVFEGAQDMLKARRIRDIIFEDWGKEPGAIHAFLGGHGFTVLALHSSLVRPQLGSSEPRTNLDPLDAPNYLATLNSDRARARFAKLGWRVLSSC